MKPSKTQHSQTEIFDQRRDRPKWDVLKPALRPCCSLCPLCLFSSIDRRRIAGFTLIEIIVTLILVSILATAAGFGIVEVARGYASAKENARMAQAAQIGLQRISRELMDLESVDVAGNSAIVVTTPSGQTAIGLFGTEIRLDDDATAADGEVLLDRAASFQISYTNLDDQPWTGSMPSNQLGSIEIRLELSRNDGMNPVLFTTRISPRNNGTPNAPY